MGMVGCAKVCLGLSVAGVILLSLWGVMLLTHSMSFDEVPAKRQTASGVGCLAAAALYMVTSALSGFVIFRFNNDASARNVILEHKYTRMSDFGKDGGHHTRGEEEDDMYGPARESTNNTELPSYHPSHSKRENSATSLSRRASPRAGAGKGGPTLNSPPSRTMSGQGGGVGQVGDTDSAANKPVARVTGKRQTSPPPEPIDLLDSQPSNVVTSPLGNASASPTASSRGRGKGRGGGRGGGPPVDLLTDG